VAEEKIQSESAAAPSAGVQTPAPDAAASAPQGTPPPEETATAPGPTGTAGASAPGSPSEGPAEPALVTLPAAELEALRARAAERDQYLDLARRTRADFENYQRRSQRDREQERWLMLASILRDLLPVLDNLQRALEAAQAAGETGPLVQGVQLVQSQFLDILRRYGVKVIDAKGQPFDHNLHEAVAQQPTADQPPNTVVQVLAPGYLLDDRVLRPAQVVVSAPA
jgi:molecular chaperone GrpE